MIDFRCVTSVKERVNPKGMKQIITEYSLKNGKKGTEIITVLDSEGNNGIRTIDKDTFGNIERVVDELYGRKEIYTSAYPMRNKGIYQSSEDGIKTHCPGLSLKDLCN